jgi:hypothetical protein
MFAWPKTGRANRGRLIGLYCSRHPLQLRNLVGEPTRNPATAVPQAGVLGGGR